MKKFDWEKIKADAKKKEIVTLKEEKWTARIIKIIIGTLVAIMILGSLLFYWYYTQSLQPVDQNNQETVEVVVPIGSTSRDIAQILYDNQLVKNADIFRFYLRSKNVSNLQAGTYTLSQSMDVDAIIEQLEAGGAPIFEDVDTKITVIEGMQIKEIAELVANNTSITSEEFMASVTSEALLDDLIVKFPSLLADIKSHEGVRYALEGYLFPATYDYIAGMSADELIIKMVEAANLRFQQVREQVDAHWMTYHQILSLASIVEREGVTEEDRKLIAGVFFNRMEAGIPIQSDITVLYALDEHKEFVTLADTEVDSPYNLYYYNGLTPGPVNSPSLMAIEAVLDPTWSDYYYFVADLDTGEVYYSTTYEEHQVLVDKYVNARQERIEQEQAEASGTSESENIVTTENVVDENVE